MRRRRALVIILCLVVAAAIGGIIVYARRPGGRTDGDEAETRSSAPASMAKPGEEPRAPEEPVDTPSGSPGDSSRPGTDEIAAATAAAVSSARANNPSIGELTVLAVRVSGSWSRVDLQPADMSTDKASWLLKKEGGAWRVADFGTSINPADHPGAPTEVFR